LKPIRAALEGHLVLDVGGLVEFFVVIDAERKAALPTVAPAPHWREERATPDMTTKAVKLWYWGHLREHKARDLGLCQSMGNVMGVSETLKSKRCRVLQM
jgi:hypothetical protein